MKGEVRGLVSNLGQKHKGENGIIDMNAIVLDKHHLSTV